MKKSLKPGTQPLISNELLEFLSAEDDQEFVVNSDEFDKIIRDTNLAIRHFIFFRDLDLIVFILNNKRLIQRPLSSFPVLEDADDYHLSQYTITTSGIHWPDIDADMSLRGLLLEETIKFAAV